MTALDRLRLCAEVLRGARDAAAEAHLHLATAARSEEWRRRMAETQARRDRRVAALWGEGLRVVEIAAEMGLGVRTVSRSLRFLGLARRRPRAGRYG